MTSPMRTDPGVDAWFGDLDHPLKAVMQRVREVLLESDERVAEMVQYGTVQFLYKSVLCSFVQVKDTRQVTLMFNAAGRLTGNFPHLEGKSVKYMYFATLADVDVRADELTGITAEWTAYKDKTKR